MEELEKLTKGKLVKEAQTLLDKYEMGFQENPNLLIEDFVTLAHDVIQTLS
jgi:hypothetical protein